MDRGRCNHVSIRRQFLLPPPPPPFFIPFYSIVVACSLSFLSHPAPTPALFAPLSLSLSLFRGYDHTLCTARHRHPQGGHSFVWYSTLTTRHFRADLRASLRPTWYGRPCARVYVVHPRMDEERIRSLASRSCLLGSTYVPCTEGNVFTGQPRAECIKFASMAGFA